MHINVRVECKGDKILREVCFLNSKKAVTDILNERKRNRGGGGGT